MGVGGLLAEVIQEGHRVVERAVYPTAIALPAGMPKGGGLFEH